MTNIESSELADFITKKFAAQKQDFNRLEVRVEKMQDGIRQMTDGLVAVNERLDRVDERLDGVESRLGKLEMRLIALEIRGDGVETRVGGLDGRFDRFESLFRIDRFDVQQRLTGLETEGSEGRADRRYGQTLVR